MNNFHTLEVVGRGSETQLRVAENHHFIMQRFDGKNPGYSQCKLAILHKIYLIKIIK